MSVHERRVFTSADRLVRLVVETDVPGVVPRVEVTFPDGKVDTTVELFEDEAERVPDFSISEGIRPQSQGGDSGRIDMGVES